MTQTTVNTKTLENGLISVYSALVLDSRADGSSYRRISEIHPDGETVREIVRDLHCGELPNDWRYETIYDLAQRFLEYSEGQPEAWGLDQFMEVVPEVSHALVEENYGELLEWAKIGSRLEFEEPIIRGSFRGIGGLLQNRQREEIEAMAYNLLRLVGDELT